MNKRYAISDIHGNAHAFLKLLDHVDPDPEELVIVGDLCNRGLDTWGVYEEVNQLIEEGTHVVVGNHDHWHASLRLGRMLPQQFHSEEIGGITTTKSIELAVKKHGAEKVDKIITNIRDNMIPYLEDEDYIFVHAGIDPRVPYMSQQKPEILMMGSPDWKNPKLNHCYDQYIVFGHTPTYMIHRDIKEEAATVWMSHRAKKIAIDTGAGFGNRLTMIDLYDGIAYAYDFRSRSIIEYRFKKGGGRF